MMTEHKRWFRVQSIGSIHRSDHPDPEAFLDPAKPSTIRIEPPWEAGLTGIEQFSHLVVLFYLDRARRRRTTDAPVHLRGRDGGQAVGFFGTRTPRRPNPIGVACPRLIRREGPELHVTGLDAWDGTPVIDLKGYYPRDEMRPDATVPDWLTALWLRHDAERGATGHEATESNSPVPAPGTVVAQHQTMHGPVTFRYPLPTDAPAALAFVNALSAEQTYVLLQGEQMTIEQEQGWVDSCLARLAAGTAITIFVFAGEQYVGSAQIERGEMVKSHIGFLGISMAPEWRGIGLGTLLMETVIKEAERYLGGLRMIQLDVFANNERGIRLYQRLGFTEYGRLPEAIHHRGNYVDLISMYRPVNRS
jgi:tRNA-Thr(GGU) m(6)t(6)A37 methyltransferase TsaA